MARHALTIAVDNLMDRLVTLEPLSIAQVLANTTASRQWLYNNQTLPHWFNRPFGLSLTDRGRKVWTLTTITRLLLAHSASATRPVSGSDDVQKLSFEFMAEALMYFKAIERTLAPTGYANISYLAPEGVTVTVPAGMDFGFNPYVGEALYIEFRFDVPFLLMNV